MIYQIVGPGYSTMPTWLDEGLATNIELQPEPAYADALATATQSETLIPLEALCGPFGIDRARAILSYAESASIVRYLQDQEGPADIRQLLEAYRDGATCEGGIQRVFQKSLSELQFDWENNVLRANPFRIFFRDNQKYFFVLAIAGVIALLAFIPKRKT